MMQAARAANTADKAASGRAPAVESVHPRAERQTLPAVVLAGVQFGDRLAPERWTAAQVQQIYGNQALMRMIGNDESVGHWLYRKCSCGAAASGGGECVKCAEKSRGALTRAAADNRPASGVPPIVNDVLRSSGHPVDPSTRALMEARFGFDFRAVRFHTDAAAAQSAAAVNALAYTLGRHVVFGAGQYSPGSANGRHLIAHELAHVIQQGAGDDVAPQTISDSNDAQEREADRAAGAAMLAPSAPRPALLQNVAARGNSVRLQLKMAPGVLQRKIVVDPPNQTGYILRQLDKLCPQHLSLQGNNISSNCSGTPSEQSCQCACDVAADPARTYTVHAYAAQVRKVTKTLWDGSKAEIPETTVYPATWPFNNPDITVENEASTVEFGSFDANGIAVWYEHWRILEHELCGHGRLQQTYTGGPGTRPGHDITIKTENNIAAERGGGARGYSWNRRQGEAFYNPIGDRSKIVFYLADGLHYEAP